MAKDGMQVIRASSWGVSQGTLEACVRVVSQDSSPEDVQFALPSVSPQYERLVLIPSQDSGPCEITLNFQQRLCHVQSIYILSTARTCEIYRRMQVDEELEYVCTVRAWVFAEDNNSENDNKDVLPDNSTYVGELSAHEEERDPNVMVCKDKERPCFGVDSGVHVSGKEECGGVENQVLRHKMISEIDSSEETYTASLHKNGEALRLRDDGLGKSVFSSSEDSWVEVKLSGSFGRESLLELEPSESTNDSAGFQKDFVSDALHTEDINKVSNNVDGEGNCVFIECCSKKEVGFTEVDKGPLEGKATTHHTFYEAEVELVEPSASASVTVRLLSLQDKSCVEVDQIVFLVTLGPSTLVPASDNLSQTIGSGGSSSLLAMLIPSMLPMVRGISPNKLGPAFSARSSSNFEESLSRLDNLDRPIRSPGTGMCTMISAAGEELCKRDSCVNSGCMFPDKPTFSMTTTKGADQVSEACIVLEDRKKRHDFRSKDTSIDSVCIPAVLKEIVETKKFLGEQEMTASSGQSLSADVPGRFFSTGAHVKESSMSGHEMPRVENFSERFDRLEGLCMRIEGYIHTAVESLDKRLKLLEAQHSVVSLQGSSGQRQCTPSEASPLTSPDLPLTRASCSSLSSVSKSEEPSSPAWQDLQPVCLDLPLPALIKENMQSRQIFSEVELGLSSEVMITTEKEVLTPALQISTPEALELPLEDSVEESYTDSCFLPKLSVGLSLDDALFSAFSAFSASFIATSRSSAESNSTIPELSLPAAKVSLECRNPPSKSTHFQLETGQLLASEDSFLAESHKGGLICHDETPENDSVINDTPGHLQENGKPPNSTIEILSVIRSLPAAKVSLEGENGSSISSHSQFSIGKCQSIEDSLTGENQKESLVSYEETPKTSENNHVINDTPSQRSIHLQDEVKSPLPMTLERSNSNKEILSVQEVNKESVETPCQKGFPSHNHEISCFLSEANGMIMKYEGGDSLDMEEAANHLFVEKAAASEEDGGYDQRNNSLEFETASSLRSDEDHTVCGQQESLCISQELNSCSEGLCVSEQAVDRIELDGQAVLNAESGGREKNVDIDGLLCIGDIPRLLCCELKENSQLNLFYETSSAEVSPNLFQDNSAEKFQCLFAGITEAEGRQHSSSLTSSFHANQCKEKRETKLVVFPGFEDFP